MQTITIEDIKAGHAKVAAMIEVFEKQPAPLDFPITIPFPLHKEGEKFTGIIISADGKKRHAIFVRPERAEGKTWQEAIAWAESLGYELADRSEGALICSVMGDQFEPGAYWLREQHASDSGYAGCQNFGLGDQDDSNTSLKLRAFVVRRLEIL